MSHWGYFLGNKMITSAVFQVQQTSALSFLSISVENGFAK
jgi:hypothetical protein